MDFVYPKTYDVIVIGAGHAGVEAAMSASRLGASTALLTQNLDTIGQMSCNPAIGGLAKGHMVREIDALGGIMGLNTDATAIQFRMLNPNKGPSVRAPRAQCDKKAYQFRLKWMVENQPYLDLHQANVAQLLIKNDYVTGLKTNLGMILQAKAIIVSAGTFMRGLMHVGHQNQKGGRMGDAISTLSDNLSELGFEIARFKTGTPCRLNGRSINFDFCDKQEGDEPPPLFSYLSHTISKDKDDIFTLNPWADPMFHVEQCPCWISYTNSKTHDIIRSNLDKSPMYSGQIEGVGPRYCPSIEDKVVRFADKERHQVFLEPEGRHTKEYYINGVSTSLPYDVQVDFIRSIAGLENAEIIRPGYAVEYDYCPPTQLTPTLETKQVGGLYFAGQINGTSGYEEAAGQGLIAGLNAALKIQNKAPLVFSRSEAYLGVMVDDLVTKGTVEPYRMFTSRAEYRLLLRQDNADLRLTPLAAELGIIDTQRRQHTEKKAATLDSAKKIAAEEVFGEMKLDKWFRRPENTFQQLPEPLRTKFDDEIWGLLETDLKYEGYLKRQIEQVEKVKRLENRIIPKSINYLKINGLKKEAQLRLHTVRPETLGQAARVHGVTPADISLLSVWVEKSHHLAG